MGNRKIIMEVLQKIYSRLDELKYVVEKTTDQELENILDNLFYEFGVNIQVNLDFMEMIITRMDSFPTSGNSNQSRMSNKELENYFEEKWLLLVYP